MEFGNGVALVVSIVTVGNILLAGLVVFNERRDIGATWAWLMVLFFIPVVGFLIYVFLGRQLKQSNFYRLTLRERAEFRSLMEEQLRHVDQGGPMLAKHAELARMNLRSSQALVTADNGIGLFCDGNEKFAALLRDIGLAQREICVQYYIFNPDGLGKRLRGALTAKAKEGVKVRILYDEIGSRRLKRTFFAELLAHGGEVEAFFPSMFRLVNFRINHRNHRKLCIIDGQVVYLGGFNVGDEYLGLNPKMGYWRDTHLRMTGGVVEQARMLFLLDWNKASQRHKMKPEPLPPPAQTQRSEGSSAVQLIASGPNSQTEHLKNMYLKMMMSARKSIYIQTPYFIPDSSFMDVCKMALLSGVDVRIMIPDKPDHPFVYSATLAYAGELLSYGVHILQYEAGFMHAKTIVVDRELASVGTMNIDPRGFRLNFEVNALIYDEEVAGRLHRQFLEDAKACSNLTPERYEARTNGAKFKESVARLLSPIL